MLAHHWCWQADLHDLDKSYCCPTVRLLLAPAAAVAAAYMLVHRDLLGSRLPPSLDRERWTLLDKTSRKTGGLRARFCRSGAPPRPLATPAIDAVAGPAQVGRTQDTVTSLRAARHPDPRA
eukprot:1808560-Pleurochrysis_carterae.AAC.2